MPSKKKNRVDDAGLLGLVYVFLCEMQQTEYATKVLLFIRYLCKITDQDDFLWRLPPLPLSRQPSGHFHITSSQSTTRTIRTTATATRPIIIHPTATISEAIFNHTLAVSERENMLSGGSNSENNNMLPFPVSPPTCALENNLILDELLLSSSFPE